MLISRRLPSELKMSIATGMLESLGLNMYTTIGKSLAEFVANAYDADAEVVTINIPFQDIDNARAKLRKAAKADVVEGKRPKFTALYDPLPDDIAIVISDDGHGMHAQQIESTFLRISRNRRENGKNKTESDKRYVMGRKGLGKLAGFGAAEKVKIWTKREGETFATEFLMDYDKIKSEENVGSVKFDTVYHHDLPADSHGTTITLSSLRCDSLKSSEETVRQSLSLSFGILGSDFMLSLNGDVVGEIESKWEYTYPETALDVHGFGTHLVVDKDNDFKFVIRYLVRFRAREGDAVEGETRERGSLPASLRGARIYCNGRLAAGPTLLKLETGMHNFHSQSYMECIVHADEVDRQNIDYIGTNRTDLKGDNSMIERLSEDVTELMRKALYEHSKFRKEKSTKQVEEDPVSKALLKRVEGLSVPVRKSAKKILGTLAEVHGVKSETYTELAPILLDGMNAGEVLSRLISLETNPQSIATLTTELLELARVENSDAMKLYRGRSSGILALEQLVKKSIDNWKKGSRFEKELHECLKENPWLIHPNYSRALTSDKPMSEVLQNLNTHLKIEPVDFTPPDPDEEEEKPHLQERPDLVFLLSDASDPTTIDVVELKSPNIPLTAEHLTQLKDYMGRVEDWAKTTLRREVNVHGYLIGKQDSSHNSRGVRVLNDEIKSAGPQTKWKVLPLEDMLSSARKAHCDALELQTKEDERFSELLD